MTIFNKAELLANYNKCKSAIKKANILPILSNIKLIVDGNDYSIIAANSIYQITSSGTCNGNDQFNICLDSDKFGLMLSSAKDDINFEVKDSAAIAKSGKSKFKFNFIDGDDYPHIKIDKPDIIDFNLSYALDGIYLSAQTNNVNPIFNGVSIVLSNNKISAYASDGFSMAFSDHDIVYDGDLKIIIPTDVCQLIANNSCASFGIDKKLLIINFSDGSVLVSKLIDANQPNFKNVIPQSMDMYFSVNRDDLLSIVNTCLKTKSLSMTIQINDEKLLIESGDDIFKFESEVSADSNGDLKESFNPVIMQSLCKIITSEVLKITYTTTDKTKKYLCSDGDKSYLMMPYRS